MKGYKNTEQALGVGDIAILGGKHRVKILDVILDEDGSWWYEVEGLDLSPSVRLLTRIVSQELLERKEFTL